MVGNTGRLLDARRTPITVTALAPELGAFEVEIQAFEDAGARWLMFMTFVETPVMNGRFNEAEAVLIGDPANRGF